MSMHSCIYHNIDAAGKGEADFSCFMFWRVVNFLSWINRAFFNILFVDYILYY